MSWPIVDLTFWNPGDGRSDAIDALLADPTTPLARHGLTGIAAAYARETGVELHETHRQWAEHLTGRSLGIDGALAHVVELFDAKGFEYFIAKGPVIAHTLYPDPGLRPYCDLDVYVAGRDEPAAREVLTEAGYEPVHHAIGVLGGLAQEMHGGPYGATVELHAHVIDNLHRRHLPPIEAFLPYVEHTTIASVMAPVLQSDAHVALQAIHAAAGHRYAKLILLRDLQGGASGAAVQRSPQSLGGGGYLAAVSSLLQRLGRPGCTGGERTTALQGWLALSLAKRDPVEWDEYELSIPNVVATIAHDQWGIALTCAFEAARSAWPRGERRVSLRVRAPRWAPAARASRSTQLARAHRSTAPSPREKDGRHV